MPQNMTDVLISEDPLYEQLYDVRAEAREIGNLVEDDMAPAISALLERAPVHAGTLRSLLGLPSDYARHPEALDGRPVFTCLGWDACNQAFRNHEVFSSTLYSTVTPEEGGLGILQMDEPTHRAYRATLQPMFLKPHTLTWWRKRFINDIVQALIDRIGEGDRAELNIQLCARLPVHTVTRAVGMDGDDSLVFRQALVRGGMGAQSMEERITNAQTVRRMLLELIAKRRVSRGDDVVSGLIDAELELPDGDRRPLTDQEIMYNCRLLLNAGGGTSWRQFGITLWALLSQREQWEAVCADRSLVESAIEESLRWNPTDPVFSRIALADAEIEGVHIPKSSIVEICMGAANRDPKRWDNPDVYDARRPVKGHIGFGVGVHQCLGMNVARSEINVGLNALMDRFPNMRLDPGKPAPELTGGLEQRGVSALHVLLR